MAHLGGGYTCKNCGTYHRTTVVCNCKQKKLLIEMMEADEKDGLYDQVPDVRKEVLAVEWLVKKYFEDYNVLISELEFEQAIQMEKEQIVEAYMKGGVNDFYKHEQAEQYYNETYGSNMSHNDENL